MREECHRKEAQNLDHSLMRSGILDPKRTEIFQPTWMDRQPALRLSCKEKEVDT
jgi:hypothetical protein